MTQLSLKKDDFVLLPLGGSGEIGMNFNLYGYQGKWLIVDCGVMFGDEHTPGIDVIVPDISFLESRRKDIVGMVITHAHEDHIGAVQYLWPQIQCPVYATGFAASVLKRKLVGTGLSGQIPVEVLPLSSVFTLNPFDIQLITLTHSIPEPNAVVIRCKAGTVLHTGDWKIDPSPVVGQNTDEAALRALRTENILAMVCDSTNAMEEGTSGSEDDVGTELVKVIAGQKQAVAVACFATNVARVHSVALAAAANGRRVVLLGRSLWRIYESAQENGYLTDLEPFLSPKDAKLYERQNLLYLCTGSQGEPRSALSKLAAGAHPEVSLLEGDTVIFSSRVIPGKEKSISAIKNNLVERGVQIISDKGGDIHVSGHPARDDLAQLYDWVRPQAVIPVHGEYRHMKAQAIFAKECQVPHSIVISNGDVIKLNAKPATCIGKVATGRLGVNGVRLQNINGDAHKAMHKAIEYGYLVASICINSDAEIVAPMQLSCLGLLEKKELQAIVTEVEDAVMEALDEVSDRQRQNDAALLEVCKKAIRSVIRIETGKKPVVEVHLVRLD